MTTVNIDGVSRDMTAEEQAEYNTRQTTWETSGRKNLKIKSVRLIRNQKLQETDWLVISEKITDEQKTWRENLRKIPQDYTDEEAYDLLLVRDVDGNLTHSIWSKP
jgi:siroheme synthase